MIRIVRTAISTPLLAGLILLQGTTTSQACPNCKEAVSLGAGEAANQANGYNWSVIFMITVPFSMMGAGGLAIRRAARRGALPEL